MGDVVHLSRIHPERVGLRHLLMSHTCHARGCKRAVPPELLMCRAHWFQVPHAIQRAVYDTYREGQCDDKRPSAAWHESASAAIGYVALIEGQGITTGEMKGLVKFGYRGLIVERYVKRLGEAKRAAIEKTLRLL